jgi:hypothetical protein
VTTDDRLRASLAEESAMRHAFSIDTVIGASGQVEEVRYHHCLTCRKCERRRLLGLPEETTEELIRRAKLQN